jgi:hypothetical protein
MCREDIRGDPKQQEFFYNQYNFNEEQVFAIKRYLEDQVDARNKELIHRLAQGYEDDKQRQEERLNKKHAEDVKALKTNHVAEIKRLEKKN